MIRFASKNLHGNGNSQFTIKNKMALNRGLVAMIFTTITSNSQARKKAEAGRRKLGLRKFFDISSSDC